MGPEYVFQVEWPQARERPERDPCGSRIERKQRKKQMYVWKVSRITARTAWTLISHSSLGGA